MKGGGNEELPKSREDCSSSKRTDQKGKWVIRRNTEVGPGRGENQKVEGLLKGARFLSDTRNAKPAREEAMIQNRIVRETTRGCIVFQGGKRGDPHTFTGGAQIKGLLCLKGKRFVLLKRK